MSIFEDESLPIDVKLQALYRSSYIMLLWIIGKELPRVKIPSHDDSKVCDTDDNISQKIKEPDFVSATSVKDSNYGKN